MKYLEKKANSFKVRFLKDNFSSQKRGESVFHDGKKKGKEILGKICKKTKDLETEFKIKG